MKAIPDPLIEVDRAIAELRRGAFVRVYDENSSFLMMAADVLTSDSLEILTQFSQNMPKLVLTGTRVNALGIDKSDRPTSLITHRSGLSVDLIAYLTNPLAVFTTRPSIEGIEINDAHALAEACITLSKLSRLLPAAMIVESLGDTDSVAVQVTSIQSYMTIAAHSLTKVSEARVPLENTDHARVLAFRPRDVGIEHLAIIVGDINPAEPILVRLHSECFTGDLLGSLRCDCGNQLRGAINEMVLTGSGILLYLAQEGRGIGLVNKLRAYQLQDVGFDTVEANFQLGFDSDERNYLPAAQILQILGVSRIKLLTNNPSKTVALGNYGVEVVERVPHIFPSNQHNDDYLRVKATKSGHLF
jgi:GTP cyclohydrolase II